jgi:hypothetical protein
VVFVPRYRLGVFERFTEGARQVVVLAQDEARALRHNYIGTEHLLLGLLAEEQGMAARVLDSLDVSPEEVRAEVTRIVGNGDVAPTGQIPFTPRAKLVLELSLREALAASHDYIGTEHMLLALATENDGVASRILLDHGIHGERIRNEVFALLAPGAPVPPPPTANGLPLAHAVGRHPWWVVPLVAGTALARRRRHRVARRLADLGLSGCGVWDSPRMLDWLKRFFTRREPAYGKPDDHGPVVPVAPPTTPFPPAMEVDLDSMQEGRVERERQERDE